MSAGKWKLTATTALHAHAKLVPHRAGSFKQPLFDDDTMTCIGVETVDGTRYYADKVVLATGAWSPTLVDLEDQCCSKVNLSLVAWKVNNC